MTNFCRNRLTITGCQEDIELFASMSQKVPQYYLDEEWLSEQEHEVIVFGFAGTIPIPQEILRENRIERNLANEGKSFSPRRIYHWMEWCFENYGTVDLLKRQSPISMDEYMREDGKMTVSIEFESLWAPPLPWMRKVSLMFPCLLFCNEYEDADGWKGIATVINGRMSIHCQQVMDL